MLCDSAAPSPGTLRGWLKLSVPRGFTVGCFSSLNSAQKRIYLYSWVVHLMTVKSHLSGTISVHRVIAIKLSILESRVLFVYCVINEETSSEGLNDYPPSHTNFQW